MSFGINIKNTNGDLLIDQTLTAYMLSDSGTVSGQDIGGGYYLYERGVEVPNIREVFIQCDVGEFLGTSTTGFVSTQSTIDYRALKLAKDLPDPTGYGLIVYDDLGQKVWFANGSVAIMDSSAKIDVSGSYTSSSDWVYITTVLPYYTFGGGAYRSLVQGVRRTTSSNYDWAAENDSLGPSLTVGPFPVFCAFASAI